MKLKYGPYSPSRLDTAICGYAFYRQYVENKDKPKIKTESLPQARGSAVHEVLELVTKRLQQGAASFSPTEVSEWVADAINRHPAAFKETQEILEMVRLYVNKPPAVLTADAGTELRLAVKLADNGSFVECGYDDPDAIGRGRADIMMISDDTTTGLVYDHKTQPNIEEADTFQLGFYAWVISKIYPFLSEIKTVLHFVRYGCYSEPYVWTKEDLAKVEDEVMTRIMVIERRTEWVPTPHKNCQYCPFIGECPAMDEIIEKAPDGQIFLKKKDFKIMGDVTRAVQTAGYINVCEELLKALKDELKDHVRKYEAPVAIPGKVFEFRASEGINWDKINKSLRTQTYAIFEKHKVDPKAFMSFNQKTSSTVWMIENEALVKELAALFPRSLSSEFRGYKV
jgi:hypothetical protein